MSSHLASHRILDSRQHPAPVRMVMQSHCGVARRCRSSCRACGTNVVMQSTFRGLNQDSCSYVATYIYAIVGQAQACYPKKVPKSESFWRRCLITLQFTIEVYAATNTGGNI